MPIKLGVALAGVSMIDPDDGERKSIKNFRLGGVMTFKDGKYAWDNGDGTYDAVELGPLEPLTPDQWVAPTLGRPSNVG